ncbi:MAG: hypothetical protein IPM74_10420 [Crocinitomicaceae bacterium]|nr:hypothetical protein [Crocinitomicaceae bacterium]MBK8926302.1 hypothetical protein [Crocinitomicaceae bacterium]
MLKTTQDTKNIVDEIIYPHSTIRLRDDGILELHTNDTHVYEIKDVIENVDAFGKLTGNKKAPVIIFGGSFTSLKAETRAFMASEESLKYSAAEAFVLRSLAQKILINFYIKFDKPLVPTKVFRDKAKAIEWLRQFK